MVNFPTWMLDCDSHSLALLDLFHSSDASICSSICYPRDIEILGWCPVGPVLPHEKKVSLQPWLATLLVMMS